MERPKVNEKRIDGVVVKRLEVFADERGKLMEIMRSDDKHFTEYGQHYLTVAYPGIIKAWHHHSFQDDNFCVVKGMAKVALYDAREDSPTVRQIDEFFIGENNPCVIHIPAYVWHGYKAIGTETVYLINMVTKAYNKTEPDEHRNHHTDDLAGYDWNGDING